MRRKASRLHGAAIAVSLLLTLGFPSAAFAAISMDIVDSDGNTIDGSGGSFDINDLGSKTFYITLTDPDWDDAVNGIAPRFYTESGVDNSAFSSSWDKPEGDSTTRIITVRFDPSRLESGKTYTFSIDVFSNGSHDIRDTATFTFSTASSSTGDDNPTTPGTGGGTGGGEGGGDGDNTGSGSGTGGDSETGSGDNPGTGGSGESGSGTGAGSDDNSGSGSGGGSTSGDGSFGGDTDGPGSGDGAGSGSGNAGADSSGSGTGGSAGDGKKDAAAAAASATGGGGNDGTAPSAKDSKVQQGSKDGSDKQQEETTTSADGTVLSELGKVYQLFNQPEKTVKQQLQQLQPSFAATGIPYALMALVAVLLLACPAGLAGRFAGYKRRLLSATRLGTNAPAAAGASNDLTSEPSNERHDA